MASVMASHTKQHSEPSYHDYANESELSLSLSRFRQKENVVCQKCGQFHEAYGTHLYDYHQTVDEDLVCLVKFTLPQISVLKTNPSEVFSAPKPRLKCTIGIMCCLSSVRPLSLTFPIFEFCSETAKQNSTKLDRKQDLNVFYQVCVFQEDWKNKTATLASDWLRHFQLLFWNRWSELKDTWQEARSQLPLPSLFFSGGSEKRDDLPGLWLAETFSTSPLKSLNGFQRNLTGSKISMYSTKFVFLTPIGKTRWLPQPLIGWDIFDFSYETAERNSTNLDRKQDLNVLNQICVFRAERKN